MAHRPNIDNYNEVKALFDRLGREFGNLAPRIIDIILDEIGGLRLRVPDLQALMVHQRNIQIRHLFTGANTEELSLRFGLHQRQIRRILQEG